MATGKRLRLSAAEREVVNKSQVVPFRMTPEEKDQHEVIATAAGLTMSDYIRTALGLKPVRRKKRPDQAELLEAARAITGIGRNLNQLTKMAHERRSYPSDETIADWVQQLDALGPELRKIQSIALRKEDREAGQ